MSDPIIPSIIRGSGPSIVIRTASGDGAYQAGTVDELQLMLGLLPTVTVQPQSTLVDIGLAANFSVTATTGVGTLTYQWQVQQSGTGAWADVAGATSASYQIAVTIIADHTDEYRCIISNGIGSVTSDTAILSINPVATMRYGVTTPANPSSPLDGTVNRCWVPYTPCHQTGVLTDVNAYFSNVGTWKIKVYRLNGYVWDEVYSSGNLTSTIGLNTVTTATFGTVSMLPGDVVGFYIPNSGGAKVVYQQLSGIGMYDMSFTGQTAATGNMLVSNQVTLRNWQFNYSVTGITEQSTTIISESFSDAALPWNWKHGSAVWSYGTGEALSGTVGVGNSVYQQFELGHIALSTWTTRFKFKAVGSSFCLVGRNTAQATKCTALAVENATGNMVVYNSYNLAAAISVNATNATGIAFVVDTEYEIVVTKTRRTMSVRVHNPAVPAETFTLSIDQETTSLPTGLFYGNLGFAALAGQCSVVSTVLTVPSARPEYLVIGDSISEGSGVATSELCYPWLLSDLLNTTMQTAAQGGATTVHTARRVAGLIASPLRPRKYVFLIGTNDGVAQEWKDRLQYMRDVLSGQSDAVIVGCVPPETADTLPETEFNPYIIAQGWSTWRNDLVLSTDGTGANRIAALFFDTLHPNEDGHTAMADRFILDQGL